MNSIIPYYHLVSDEQVLHVKHLQAYKTIRQFGEDLEFLLKKYRPIGLQEVLALLKRDQPLPRWVFLLTFDDGLREMNDVVAPILLQRGIPAVFFINNDFVDNKQMFYLHKASLLIEHLLNSRGIVVKEIGRKIFNRNDMGFAKLRKTLLLTPYEKRSMIDEMASLVDFDFGKYLAERRPYLTSDQIQGLLGKGFCFGSHSMDHPRYSSLSLEDQIRQTKQSVMLIKERWQLDYGVFAFPHGDGGVSREFFQRIYEPGLVNASFGTAGTMEDVFPQNLQRISFEKPFLHAKKILAYQLGKKIYRANRGKDKLTR